MWVLTVSNKSLRVVTEKYLSYNTVMRTFEEHKCRLQQLVTISTSWLVFSIKEIRMRKSSMANAKPPECNSISTTEVAVTDITRGGFNGVKFNGAFTN